MGSFPNKTAANILKLLFNSPTAVAEPSVYTTTGSSAARGIRSEIATAGSAVTLYIGLIEATFGSPPGPGVPSNFIQDSDMVSSGVTNWPITPGSNSFAEYKTTTSYTRPAITFGTVANDSDTNSAASVSGPSTTVTFGTAAAAQTTGKQVVGFFITTLASAQGNSSTPILPTVVAYGQLSSARYIQSGDQPTFATNAITITLD